MQSIDGTNYTWDMEIGYIDPKYQNINYFYNYKVNMLGLAAIMEDSSELI